MSGWFGSRRPARRGPRTYRPPRGRRELATAAIAVIVIVGANAGLVWAFAPPGEKTIPPIKDVTPKSTPKSTSSTTATTTATTAPTAPTATTAPPASTP